MPRPQLPPDESDTSFGARCIRYRIKENLTRRELASQLEAVAPISEKGIRRWENEGALPRDPRHYVEMISRIQSVGL